MQPSLRPIIIAIVIAVPLATAVIAAPLQSLSQLAKSGAKTLTAAERTAALKRLGNSNTPQTMGATITVTPSVPVRNGVAMGYVNAVQVVTGADSGGAALQSASSSPPGAVTLNFPVSAQKSYLIDCALAQYNELAWSIALNGATLTKSTSPVFDGHLSVLTPVLKAGGTLGFIANPPPGSGSQYMILTSCSVTEVG